MHQHYRDILDRIPEKPLWFDESGVPRYVPFAPNELNCIYVKEAALAEIACQSCGTRFRVALSERFCARAFSLSDEIRQRIVHYGDPPNIDCCDVGHTQNSVMLDIIEYWTRGLEVGRWIRYPDFEGTVIEQRLQFVDATARVASLMSDGQTNIRVACTSERKRQDILGHLASTLAPRGLVLIAEPNNLGVVVSNTLEHYAATQNISRQTNEILLVRPSIIRCTSYNAKYLDIEEVKFAILVSPYKKEYRQSKNHWSFALESLLDSRQKIKIELSLADTPVLIDTPDVIVDAGLLEAC